MQSYTIYELDSLQRHSDERRWINDRRKRPAKLSICPSHIVGDCFTKQYVQELKGLPFSMKIKMLSTFKLPPSRVRVHAWSMQIFASSV